MADILKQRLVGALILVSAVIGLAIFLVTSAHNNSPDKKQTVSPENDFVSSISAVEPVEVLEADTEVLVDPQNLQNDDAQLPEKTVNKSDISNSAVQASSDLDNKQKETVTPQVNNDVKTDSPTENKNITSAAKTELSTPQDDKQFVIQVASFSKKTNALALKNKLSELGLNSHIENVSNNNKTIFRVRIGPEQGQNHVDTIVTKIKTSLNLQPQVINYQPK